MEKERGRRENEKKEIETEIGMDVMKLEGLKGFKKTKLQCTDINGVYAMILKVFYYYI